MPHPSIQSKERAMSLTVIPSLQNPFPVGPTLFQISRPTRLPTNPTRLTLTRTKPVTRVPASPYHDLPTQDDGGIPMEDMTMLARFKSRFNYIRVLEVSRRSDHPLAGSRILLLDAPGNIHSICFRFSPFTTTYFDVFATIPPVLPPGPVAVLGFGAGSTARLLLELYPDVVVHGWEIDPSVIAVGREFFGVADLERRHKGRVFIYIGNALDADLEDGFSGIFVDLFSKGCMIPELQDPETWRALKRRLRRGGRMVVNVGGRCIEAEDTGNDGGAVMEETLKAMEAVFGSDRVFLRLGGDGRGEDSSVAMTGAAPDWERWRKKVPQALRGYVGMWRPVGR